MIKTLLIETPPRDTKSRLGSANFGAEIAARELHADRVLWWDKDIDASKYDRIAFNVFYPMHAFNALAFLRKHRIPLLRCDRQHGPEVLFGGQGAQMKWLEEFGDVFIGEIDGDIFKHGRSIKTNLDNTSPLLSDRIATLELTRGCKHRCNFCEYAWAHGGPYREKSTDAACEQLDWCADRGFRNVNLMSANLFGYSGVKCVFDHAATRNVNILSTDVCLVDWHCAPDKALLRGKTFKIGVESFDEATRFRVNKKVTDNLLYSAIDDMLEVSSHLHFYLIYGLPSDDYGAWLDALERLKVVRDRWVTFDTDILGDTMKQISKPVRFEFSITNFEPCLRTPLVEAPQVDFIEKERFLQQWISALNKLGFPGKRFGRRECVYRVLMTIKHAGPEIVDAVLSSFPRGIPSSPDERDCVAFTEAAKVRQVA